MFLTRCAVDVVVGGLAEMMAMARMVEMMVISERAESGSKTLRGCHVRTRGRGPESPKA